MEEKKNKQAQEGRSLWNFPSILWANASVYSSEIPTKPPGMLTHLLTLANPASQSSVSSSCTLLPIALLSSLVSSVLSSLDCSGTLLPSSSSSLVVNLAHKPFVWVSRQNRHMNLLTGTYPHPHNECWYRVTNYIKIVWHTHTHTHTHISLFTYCCSTKWVSLLF